MTDKWALRDLNPRTSDYESLGGDFVRDAGQGVTALPPSAPSEVVAPSPSPCGPLRHPAATNPATSGGAHPAPYTPTTPSPARLPGDRHGGGQ